MRRAAHDGQMRPLQEKAPRRQATDSPTIATGTFAKVEVSARPAATTRSAGHHEATAIHLTIHNHGDKPLRLGHAQLSLMDAHGKRYPALPLRRVAPTTTGRADTVDEFLDSTINPPSHDRAVAANDGPKPIPQGVVDPRERVTGMVYFKKVPAEAIPMRLVIQLVDARDDTPIGRMQLPIPSVPSAKLPKEGSQLEEANNGEHY